MHNFLVCKFWLCTVCSGNLWSCINPRLFFDRVHVCLQVRLLLVMLLYCKLDELTVAILLCLIVDSTLLLNNVTKLYCPSFTSAV